MTTHHATPEAPKPRIQQLSFHRRDTQQDRVCILRDWLDNGWEPIHSTWTHFEDGAAVVDMRPRRRQLTPGS